MFRKILKWSLKILIGTLLFFGILYGGFHLWEYASGGKYVEYLTANSETVPIEETFSYETIGKDLADKKLILVGEIHGFDEPSKFDVDFFKYLHQNHQVNHYLAELDFVQATLLNDFLKTGDQKTLSAVLAKWAVEQGRNNQDYFDKYLSLHQYYQEQSEGNKFEFIGIDRIQDRSLLQEYIQSLAPENTLEPSETDDMGAVLMQIEQLSAVFSQSPDTLFLLSHLKSNVQYVQEKLNREEVLFKNFSHLYKECNLEDHKLYGFFGLYHVFQYRINGNHPLASKIRESDLGLADKILSINIMMNDSYMVMPSNQLPEFMSDGSDYVKMPVSADNMLFMYIVGISDFKRMTPEHHKSLIKMNSDDSPYSNTIRLSQTIQLLPVTDKMEMTDEGKPYAQYTLFVRNSDWAEPMKK